MIRTRARRLFALFIFVGLVGGTAVSLARRKQTREELLNRLGAADELEPALDYDPFSQQAALASDSGRPALLVLDTRRGGTPRRIPVTTPWPRRPVISPHGRWLAYHELDTREMTWEGKLFVVDLRSESQRLVRAAGANEYVSRATFSPDGQHLIYELVHKIGDAWRDELRSYEPASGNDETFFSQQGVSARGPAWSPDGNSVYVISGRCVRRISATDHAVSDVACLPAVGDLGDLPEPPVVSPDGAHVAFTLHVDGCPRVFVANTDGSGWHRLEPNGCSRYPVWLRGPGLRVAFIAMTPDGNRLPRLRNLDAGRTLPLGFDTAITYRLAATADGQVIALLGAPGQPRSVWRINPTSGEHVLLYSPIDRDILDRTGSEVRSDVVTSADGLRVPIRVFPAACKRKAPGPAVVFVHGGKGGRDDISPRFYQEIGYLNLAGITVIGVNYRGSTGYGDEYKRRSQDVKGQMSDVRAAVEYARGLPGIAPDRVFLVATCYGALPAGLLADAEPTLVAGVVELTGPPMPWLQADHLVPKPPLLWVSDRFDPGARGDAQVAARATALGYPVEFVELDEGHIILNAEDRARSLQLTRAFIDGAAPSACAD